MNLNLKHNWPLVLTGYGVQYRKTKYTWTKSLVTASYIYIVLSRPLYILIKRIKSTEWTAVLLIIQK